MFLLAIIDSAGLPMVGGVDALVILLAVVDHSSAYWAATAAVLGSLVGNLVLFYIARVGGEAYLARYTSHGRGARFRQWFLEYGLITIYVPAAVPIIPMPMKIFVLTAGALEVSPVTFTVVLAAARIPRYFFLAWMGTRLGEDTLPYLKGHIWELLLLALTLFVVLYLLIRFLDRRRKIAQITD